jgi:hypothetical protein
MSRGQSVDARRGCLEALSLMTAPAASRFIDVLADICGDGNGERDVARLTATTGREALGNPL